MTRDEIYECVKKNIHEVLPEVQEDEIDEEYELYDLGANSVDRAEITDLITEEMDVCIPRTEFSGVKKVGEIIDVFYKKSVD